MIWDVTVVDTLAASHLPITSTQAGGAAQTASLNKEQKYAELSRVHTFIPIACETLGPIDPKAMKFLQELGGRIAAVTGDSRETSFLLQRLSVCVQRYNSVCFQGSFVEVHDIEG